MFVGLDGFLEHKGLTGRNIHRLRTGPPELDEPPVIAESSRNTVKKASPVDELYKGLSDATKKVGDVLTRNAFANIVRNVYSFFYSLPKDNTPYDVPWTLFKNSSVEFIAWYQFPRNLPPYGYLGEGFPDDMFCWGLPGNTLPLGNWDPCGFQLVSPAVVKKYRESEIKHGRLAMLGSLGCVVQEQIHPLHENIGGLAVTHMAQLRNLPLSDSCSNMMNLLSSVPDTSHGESLHSSIVDFPLDYWMVVLALSAFELGALKRNWRRWERDGYNHQFDTNIGIGNLKDTYSCGNYGFDPLGLFPNDPHERRTMVEKELNHGRLAMIACLGIFVQEYLTGVPIQVALQDWSSDGGLTSILQLPLRVLEGVASFPDFIESLTKVPDLGFVNPLTP